MCTTEGICDWCKRSALLTPHHYLDGKTHHSCQECHAFATLDVRLYNIGEKAEQERRNARQRLEIQL
ncbi:hypothetical protein SBX37_13200 [Vibrio mangrovi]|uniref:Uncharacterized protein n=1 Tax=Vibrio mangrovi TaxID=474394 RepID=A0ABU4I808_9VIBR|nr:hypothetical protein [Vibrio mangrovi]MDW6003807.1 hypothetical protein [Vibrio mangrovi]